MLHYRDIFFQACVNSISQTECLAPMKQAMRQYNDIIGIASETLSRIFAGKKDSLVKQVFGVSNFFLLPTLGNNLQKNYTGMPIH